MKRHDLTGTLATSVDTYVKYANILANIQKTAPNRYAFYAPRYEAKKMALQARIAYYRSLIQPRGLPAARASEVRSDRPKQAISAQRSVRKAPEPTNEGVLNRFE